MAKIRDRRDGVAMPPTTDERAILRECDQRFRVAEARLAKHDQYIRENDEKTTEALVKIDGLTKKVAENTEEVKELTGVISALNTHLEKNAVRIDERFSVAGQIVRGLWMLAIGLAGSGVTVLYQLLSDG